ncbi:SMI1/KNR4 family protein [Kitasatospora sp. NPDC051853]|uniref:SMI1/KNR4 family protein n=1 Tax=Kitasatospora sp. NPDC051853 TaxID=3364058 RepID=UPI00378F0AC9
MSALRGAAGAEEVFGAGKGPFGHGFVLEPPLAEEQLAEAERDFGVALPPSYRSFLREVGGGGAGPYYGLFPLRRDEAGWYWNDSGVRTDGSGLAGPFLSAEERARLEREYDAREPDERDFPDGQAYRAARGAWSEEEDELEAALEAGALCLSHEGCGYYVWLAVTGPGRGTLFTDMRPSGRGFEPIADDFRGWYLTWLDRAEETVRRRGR